MLTEYLIADRVIFNPAEHTLRSVNSVAGEQVYQINAPASKCFYILIENQNNIVTQSELFESVWGKQGTYVSINTLYQNISLLRKALRSLGIVDAIKTVSKKGFMLLDTVSVQSVDVIESDENSTLNVFVEPKYVEETFSSTYTSFFILSSLTRLKLLLIMFFCTVIITFLFWRFIQSNHDMHSGFFDNYIKLTSIGQCKIFQPVADKTNDRYLTYVNNNNFICDGSKFIYLTIPAGRMQVSEVVCNKSIYDSGVQCTSYNSYNKLRE